MTTTLMQNFSFEGVTPVSETDATAKVLDIGKLNYASMGQVKISDFSVVNSSFSLLNLDGISNINTDAKEILLENISYRD